MQIENVKQQVRRWRLLNCFTDRNSEQRAKDAVRCYEQEGFKAKIWAPLPQHKTSGHVHVVVLCTLDEKVILGFHIRKKYGLRPCPDVPWLLAELKKVRGF